MDVLIPALEAMPSFERITPTIPVVIQEGSLETLLQGSPSLPKASHELSRGATHRWTPETHRETEPFYAYLRKRRANLKCGQRRLREVIIPPASGGAPKAEYRTIYADMWGAGGEKGTVQLKTDFSGIVMARAGQKLAKELSPHLYERLAVTGRMVTDFLTGRIIDFEIQEWRQAPLLVGDEREAALEGFIQKYGAYFDEIDLEAMIEERHA